MYLLRWNFKGLAPHVNFLVDINTGDNEENARPAEQFSFYHWILSCIFLKHIFHSSPILIIVMITSMMMTTVIITIIWIVWIVTLPLQRASAQVWKWQPAHTPVKYFCFYPHPHNYQLWSPGKVIITSKSLEYDRGGVTEYRMCRQNDLTTEICDPQPHTQLLLYINHHHLPHQPVQLWWQRWGRRGGWRQSRGEHPGWSGWCTRRNPRCKAPAH